MTVNAGTVDLGGNSQSVTNFNGVAGTITSSVASRVTLTVGPTAASVFGGLLQNGAGTLSLAMNGPGLLTLSGTNTYSGATTISGGTLALANAGAIQNSTANLSGGALAFAASGLTYNVGSLAGNGNLALTATNGGAVTLSLGANGANSTFSGA